MVISNEVIDDGKGRKKPIFIFKVDFEKAYDFVRLEFLYYMMRRMSLGEI